MNSDNTTTTTTNNTNNASILYPTKTTTSGGNNNNNNGGWGVSVDPASGRVFYHHPLYGSQWDKPKEWVDGVHTSTSTTANTSTSGSSGSSGGGSTVSVTVNASALPDGWSSSVDPASGRTFYYRTGQSGYYN